MSRNKHPYKLLYCLSAVELLILALLQAAIGEVPSDSITYFSAWDSICGGQIDNLRTPVYPIFIGILHFPWLIALVQSVLFLCSIRWMRDLLSELGASRSVTFYIVAFYALFPGVLSLCSLVLTETLALVGMVALLLLSLRAFRRNRWQLAAWAALLMLAMVFLRPALIYLPVCFLLLWLVIFCVRRHLRKVAIMGVAGCVVCFGALALYSAQMKRVHDVAGTSSVSAINNYFAARGAAVLIPSEIQNPRIAALVDSLIATNPTPTVDEMWLELPALVAVGGPRLLGKEVSAAIASHPADVGKYILMERFRQFNYADCFYGGNTIKPLRAVTQPFCINNGAANFLVLISMVLLLCADLRHRRFSIFPWFLCGTFIVACVVVLAGAPGEWPRLLVPDIPVLLSIAAIAFTRMGCDTFRKAAA